jgi:hypothetical protein
VLVPLLRRLRWRRGLERLGVGGAAGLLYDLETGMKSQLCINAIPSSTYTKDTRMSNVLKANEVVKTANIARGIETMMSTGGPRR